MALRILGVGVLLLALLVYAGHRSGSQPERDAVAAAERSLGIPLEAGRVPVRGLELFVVQAGPAEGPPVVLLHGYPEFWYAWHRQMAHLAKAGFRVIVPDQRGYDRSDKPGDVSAYHIRELRADVVALLDALGHETAFLAGHDWGGGVGWSVVLHHPERIRKFLVVNTPHPGVISSAGDGDEETISWYRTFFQIPWLPEFVGRLGNWSLLVANLRNTSREGIFPDEEMDLYRSAWDHEDAMRTMVHWYRAAFREPADPPPQQKVEVPTRVVVALHDAFIPASSSRRSLDHCTNADVVEVDAGHWVLHEEPDRMGELLVEFFSDPG